MNPTDVLPEQKRQLLVKTVKLEVIAGIDRGRSIEISDEVAVGKDPSAALVLADPAVSRLHFAIGPIPDGWRLRDLGSTNGTTINGVRVVDAVIAPGHAIVIGQTTLHVTLAGVVEQALSSDSAWGRALGTSAAMRRLFERLPRVASSESVVLLEGETGTGKTLLAEMIHRHSQRRRGPFVVVDCGAIAPTLVESELFGHEKGAFTGANSQRIGAFEAAAGGTVFFDKLGELPLDLQPKLLRAIEDRRIRRVGGTATIDLDVRVIAATNRDLRAEVNRRTFRSDLYYRLNTISIRAPALRERVEDIPMLAAHFWRQFAGDLPLPAELLAELVRRDWPGNVRELRSAVERAAVFGETTTADLHPPSGHPASDVELVDGQPFRAAKHHVMAQWERAYVRALVERHAGNLTRAARAARMDRSHLRDLLYRHWPEHKTPDDDD